MLRLRKNLQPRVSNNLALLSAALLLVCYVVGSSGEMPVTPDGSSNLSALVQTETTGQELGIIPSPKTAARKGINISLMIFRHN